MLHKDPFIISPETFKLIQQLQELPELESFFLVGGTALSLQLSHRNSIDIDLFTQNNFDSIDIYYLLNHICMAEMIGFFVKKYTYSNPMIAMKAINYFDEIDESIDPPKLLRPLAVKEIKKRIQEASQKPNKISN